MGFLTTTSGTSTESRIRFDFSAGILALQEETETPTPDLQDASPAELAATADDLAKQTQNPVADLISLPFRNDFTSPTGPDDGVMYVLKIQPVIPISIGRDWNRPSQKWTVPLGGGIGKISRIGNLPVNIQL